MLFTSWIHEYSHAHELQLLNFKTKFLNGKKERKIIKLLWKQFWKSPVLVTIRNILNDPHNHESKYIFLFHLTDLLHTSSTWIVANNKAWRDTIEILISDASVDLENIIDLCQPSKVENFTKFVINLKFLSTKSTHCLVLHNQ